MNFNPDLIPNPLDSYQTTGKNSGNVLLHQSQGQNLGMYTLEWILQNVGLFPLDQGLSEDSWTLS